MARFPAARVTTFQVAGCSFGLRTQGAPEYRRPWPGESDPFRVVVEQQVGERLVSVELVSASDPPPIDGLRNVHSRQIGADRLDVLLGGPGVENHDPLVRPDP